MAGGVLGEQIKNLLHARAMGYIHEPQHISQPAEVGLHAEPAAQHAGNAERALLCGQAFTNHVH